MTGLMIAGATNVAGKVEQKVLEVLDAQLSAVREKLTSGSVEEVLPEKWRSEAEERIPAVTTYILSKSELILHLMKEKRCSGN